MFKSRLDNKNGIVLYVVLCIVFVVLTLASVILSIISNQTRFTHHQVSRIQAYYAAMAGVTYALEQLRTGIWTSGSCPGPVGCPFADLNFPSSIVGQNFNVITTAPGGGCTAPTGGACVRVTVTYTYP